MYTIGQLAKAANVNVETIRYYEKKGFIKQPKKPKQGYRQYPSETLTRIIFIKRAQHLDFSLSEISILLSFNASNCNAVQELAETKLASIKQKIRDLRKLEKSLKSLIDSCASNKDDESCPIIQSLVPETSRSS